MANKSIIAETIDYWTQPKEVAPKPDNGHKGEVPVKTKRGTIYTNDPSLLDAAPGRQKNPRGGK